ncbi:protein kinase [Kocuria palustris]|nr:protein kinase [Kocuria palustris]
MFESSPAKAVVTAETVESLPPRFAIDMYPGLPDRYRLELVIGEGAFSSVYRAVDTETDATVAIKIINKVNMLAKQLKNIRNEVEIMQELPPHPNTLKLIDTITTITHTYLVLEYSDGGEIFNKIIEYTYFSEPLCRHVFAQLLSAVDHLHRHDVVHRDIKPENLLFSQIPFFPRDHDEFKKLLRSLDDELKKDEGEFRPGVGGATIGTIKLADYGLAKRLVVKGSNHPMKTPCGTAGYTAPEVINVNQPRNSSEADSYSKLVDVWSLGCFLYTILCGFPPFYDEDHAQLSQRILRGDFVFLTPWWDEISDEVKDLITQMLTIDPDRRITIDGIWQHSWMRGATRVSTDADDAESSVDYFGASTTPPTLARTPGVHDPQRELRVKQLLTPHRLMAPLKSPAAHAIKLVFDNPAMANPNHVRFIETINEGVETRLRGALINLSIDPLAVPERRRCLVRLPFPDKLKSLAGFNEVFYGEMNDDDSDEDEDDDDEADDSDNEEGDKLTTLAELNLGPRLQSRVTLTTEDEDELLLDSNLDSQTRLSLIILGIAGDFKFTLNLNDSNLLTRRRSLTMKKCHDMAPGVVPEMVSKTVSH